MYDSLHATTPALGRIRRVATTAARDGPELLEDRSRAFLNLRESGTAAGAGKPSIGIDQDGVRDGTLDGDLGLIALENDPWECLQHPDRRSRRDAKRRQPVSAAGEIA